MTTIRDSFRPFITSAFSTLLLVLLMSWTNKKTDKVLIFSKNVDNQQSAAAAAGTLMTLAEKAGIDVDTTTNGDYITEDSLKNYRAVILLNTSEDVLFTNQQADIERFVQAGGGLGFINTPGFTKYQWAWYQDILAANQIQPSQAPFSIGKPFDGGRVFY
ncbi:MAG: ThuA domain-containing protein, partial [Cytophagaceae bacterium]